MQNCRKCGSPLTAEGVTAARPALCPRCGEAVVAVGETDPAGAAAGGAAPRTPNTQVKARPPEPKTPSVGPAAIQAFKPTPSARSPHEIYEEPLRGKKPVGKDGKRVDEAAAPPAAPFNLPRFITMVAAVLVTFLSVGIVHGLWTERWPAADARDAMLAEIKKALPAKVGAAWEKAHESAVTNLPVDDASNYVQCAYLNRVDGTAATVMLTRGRPGPMVLKHLPTECYPAAGYEQIGDTKLFLCKRDDDKAPADQFWYATFKKSTDLYPQIRRVYWSWSGDGQWQAPKQPRLTFARYPVIYKLYVVRSLLREDEQFEGAPVHGLIKDLTNEMRRSFFSPLPQ